MNEVARPRPTTAIVGVDFEMPGKQIGFVRFPHSPEDDAWGMTQVPIAVISGGTGPTVILAGGNHGDEHEGPITIGELIRELDPGTVNGRLILLPAMNVHAVKSSRRNSPVDGLNFNRTFPGDPYGSITQQISAYINDHIFPLGDAFLDLHSGGSSLNILPSAIVEPAADPGLHKRNIAATVSFDAPCTVVISNLGDPRTATASACRAGLVTVGTEMAGGAQVTVEALRICRRGVRNVLAHLGVLDNEARKPRQSEMPLLEISGPEAYLLATTEGVFEPFHRNGKEVSAGQPAGRIHNTWNPAQQPEMLYYSVSGVVFAQRRPGRVQPGNCCVVIAAPYRGA